MNEQSDFGHCELLLLCTNYVLIMYKHIYEDIVRVCYYGAITVLLRYY